MPKFGRNQRRGVPRARARQGVGMRGNQGQMVAITHPPEIQPQIIHHQRMRYACTTVATNKVISFQNLLDTLLVASTAILGWDVFDQVRLDFVEVWAVPAIGGTAYVSVQYAGGVVGQAGDGRVHSDNSMGIEPAHVHARPNAQSQVALWQTSSANQAFVLTCPVGSIIDVSLSFRTLTVNAPTAAQNALVGAAVADFYYRGLDGLASAGTTLPAQAPSTI